jgi:uncharacterized protein (DUF2225 family)
MTEEEIESQKRQIMETINMLREEHLRHLAPYIKMLVDLENIRPRVYKVPICPICVNAVCTCDCGEWK